MVRAVRRGNRLRGTRPFVLACHWSKSSPFEPLNRRGADIVAAPYRPQRFALAVAALDRFALLVRREFRLAPHVSHPAPALAAGRITRTPTSYDAQEEGESPIDPQQQSVAGFPDHVADFGNRTDRDFVDGDLRNFARSVLLRGINLEPELIRIIAKRRRQRANHHGRQLGEKIALHDERGARLALIPRRRNDHELSTPHYGSGHS
jgi:hypothetical protein